MAKHVLHFTGLQPGTHTNFRNRRGGEIRVDPGGWVLVDDVMNPNWRSWVDSGAASLETEIPDGVDYLDENSRPKPLPEPPRSNERRTRGALNILGPLQPILRLAPEGPRSCTVGEIPDVGLERIRETFMPPRLEDIGISYHDCRLDRRGGQRVSTVPPPFEINFLILVRLAWLSCRREVEREIARDEEENKRYASWMRDLQLEEDGVDHPGPKAIRAKIEAATGKVLHGWGLIRTPRLPNRITLYRQLVQFRLDVGNLDAIIMHAWTKTLGPQQEGRPAKPRQS